MADAIDAVETLLDDLLPGMSNAAQVAIAAGVAVLVLAALVAVVVAVRRRWRRPRPLGDSPGDGLVRRPAYLDTAVVGDLLGHTEQQDHSRELRDALETGDDDARTPGVRALNKVLSGLEAHDDLLADLDLDPEAGLHAGKVVRVTGRLEPLPATDAVELLERAAPLLGMQPDPLSRDPAPTTPVHVGPLVMRLTPATGDQRRFLVILDRDALRGPAADLVEEKVTVLAVAQDVLARRDSLDIGQVIRSRLSLEVRDALSERDLSEVVATLSRVTPNELDGDALEFTGPGARLEVGAIYR